MKSTNWINNRYFIPMDKAFRLAELLGVKSMIYIKDLKKNETILKFIRI